MVQLRLNNTHGMCLENWKWPYHSDPMMEVGAAICLQIGLYETFILVIIVLAGGGGGGLANPTPQKIKIMY